MNNAKKHMKHLYIISFLLIVFITTLFVSVSSSNISTNYTFKDYVTYTKDSNINVGTLNIVNSGFMPKRVKLKEYWVCSFDNQSISSKIDIYSEDYTRVQTNYMDSSYYQYIDVSSKENLQLMLTLPEYIILKPVYENDIKKDIQNSNISLYIFEVGEAESYRFDRCTLSNKEDAIHIIEIKN